MSFTFSRRNFLKYSALATVAVAGAGLFSGCTITSDGSNLYLLSAGDLTVLDVTAAMGTLQDKKYIDPDITGTTITFPMKVTNGRTNSISINPYNFKVTVASKDGKTTQKYTGTQLTIADTLCDTNLKKGSSLSGNITVTLPQAITESGATVTLTYCPDLKYSEYTMNWKLTRA